MKNLSHGASEQENNMKRSVKIYKDVSNDPIDYSDAEDIMIPENLLQDSEELGDLLVLTINKALEKAQEVNDREMQSMAMSMFKQIVWNL